MSALSIWPYILMLHIQNNDAIDNHMLDNANTTDTLPKCRKSKNKWLSMTVWQHGNKTRTDLAILHTLGRIAFLLIEKAPDNIANFLWYQIHLPK